MKIPEFSKLGWTMVAALVGVVFAVGFQTATTKIGIVDIAKVMDDSDMGKASQALLTKMNKDRVDILEFMSENRVLTEAQAKRLRELWLKDGRTPAEETEFLKLKTDISADAKRANDLTNKPTSLTPEEHSLLDDFARRSQITQQVGTQFKQDFAQELDKRTDTEQRNVLSKARISVQIVAKAQDFTVVFEARIAPFAANDITQSTLDAMNAQK
jgi:Skp family chaperone for outer membrane proteins